MMETGRVCETVGRWVTEPIARRTFRNGVVAARRLARRLPGTLDVNHHPTEMIAHPNGDIYVTDGYRNARVHRFTREQ